MLRWWNFVTKTGADMTRVSPALQNTNKISSETRLESFSGCRASRWVKMQRTNWGSQRNSRGVRDDRYGDQSRGICSGVGEVMWPTGLVPRTVVELLLGLAWLRLQPQTSGRWKHTFSMCRVSSERQLSTACPLWSSSAADTPTASSVLQLLIYHLPVVPQSQLMRVFFFSPSILVDLDEMRLKYRGVYF